MKERDIRKALAGKLYEFRRNAGLTAKEVGQKIGKSDKTVSGWEHGRGQPDADTLFRLCEIYGINDISAFYSLPDDKKGPPPRDELLIDLFHRLNDEGQEKVLDYVDDLVRSGKYIKTRPAELGDEA